jgi:hypothetical protein
MGIMPAVVVTGARQTGKSTLAPHMAPPDRRFYSLDDLDVMEQARLDPAALLGGMRPVTLDEVQREPDLGDRRRELARLARLGRDGTGGLEGAGAPWRIPNAGDRVHGSSRARRLVRRLRTHLPGSG